jgi:hypothetical protein
MLITLNSSVETTACEDIAHFSECGNFRYLLTREFGGEPTCLFIMLNPSTADAERDDPTIRRCTSFAKREGFGRLEVVNLYGFRSPSPSVLFASPDPAGPDNDREIEGALDRADSVVVAWGNHAEQERVNKVVGLIERSGKASNCFGLTKLGQPKHPLYLKAETSLRPLSS